MATIVITMWYWWRDRRTDRSDISLDSKAQAKYTPRPKRQNRSGKELRGTGRPEVKDTTRGTVANSRLNRSEVGDQVRQEPEPELQAFWKGI